ncbi:MAG: hypothetical protein V1703_01720 [Candidatus Altiarchaeota archaeon]
MDTPKVLLFFLSFLLLLLIPCASAWSNNTYIYVCDNAVRYVWGSEALETCIKSQSLDFQKNFCNVLLLHAGEEAYSRCMAENSLTHPALMSNLFFNDPEYHRDYSSCPIRSDIDSKYLCAGDNGSPVLERSLMWFDIAKNAPDLCTRIYEFCIGSSYIADACNPLSHLSYGVDQSDCSLFLDNKVEERLLEQTNAGWSIAQVCKFRYIQPKAGQNVTVRYTQEFVVSNKTFADLIVNITYYGSQIHNVPYSTTTTVITTTTEATTTVPSVESTLPGSTTTTEVVMVSTTFAESGEAGGIGWLPILLILAVVVATLFYISKNPEVQKMLQDFMKPVEGAPVSGKGRTAQRPKSLRFEHRDESILPQDRVHSRLGKAGRRETEEQ